MSFAPIAIVGQGCVLPGAFSPQELWDHVLAGRDLISSVPPGYWRVDPQRVLVSPEAWGLDKIWSDRGGYVHGFEDVFDPEGFELSPTEVLQLDEQFHWVLFAARAALGTRPAAARARCGLVLGNLAYPTFALTQYAESVWMQRTGGRLSNGLPRPHPRNRFHAGSIAPLTARALGLGGAAFALDAACASSLYALKLACDRLHDGRADLMLAGAVNRTDDLLIRAGFCALGALSRTGRSRPFHRGADGLVPAEGAVLVALKRLEDAVAGGDAILGVIRGIGLSNDGRQGGFLSPGSAGQTVALRQAYRQAGLSPRDVSLVECHATGTPVGDRVELKTLRTVFADCDDVPLGSLKSNLGHLITAAGAAGLLKVLAAFAAGVRPPTLHAEEELEEIAAPFRLLHRPEPWACTGPRRAALNAFGFGGTNAHLIVEEWQPTSAVTAPLPRPPEIGPVAVVGLGVRAGALDTESFAQRLGSGVPLADESQRRIREIVLDAQAVLFPPRDLERTLPQQLLVLEVVAEATGVLRLPVEATAVLVGMQCDAELARYAMRLRLPGWARQIETLSPEWVAQAQDAVQAPLDAAAVIGGMPNIPANRVNVQLDLRGPGFTVAAEELSGLQALALAVRGLKAREFEAAVVAAVDLCCEPVHMAAAEVLPPGRCPPGDAAVALVLKRLADARRDGDAVLATLEESEAEPERGAQRGLAELVGHAHAASGLLLAAAGVLSIHRRSHYALFESNASGHVCVAVTALGGQRLAFQLREPERADSEGAKAASSLVLPADFPLRFAGHLPEIVLPPLPQPAATTANHAPIQVMRPAPVLRPVLDAEMTAPASAASRPEALVPSPENSPPLEARHRTVRQAAADQGRVFQNYLKNAHASQRKILALHEQAAMLIVQGQHPAAPPAQANGSFRAEQETARCDAPAPMPAPDPLPAPRRARGPSFGREQLLELSRGKVSAVFGPLFERQDGYARQVRLPTPPLLLVDRITDIDAAPGVLGTGAIWTETDVRWGEWYLQDGVMAAGAMIEAGQADLTLISWMGADFENRGERVYRLLGCDLTYYGGLPRPGETLCYDIHVTGHARQGDVRLFFFQYDCRVNGALRLTVRNGQAGFFTDRELAESSGIRWAPETAEYRPDARLDPPRVPCRPASFDPARVSAWFAGRPFDCFGDAYQDLLTHVRSPRGGTDPSGTSPGTPHLQFFDEVTHCDAAGGPQGRGYLRVRKVLHPEDWFFQGHFHNDPCMPGNLMFEGALQAMAFYLTWLGYTLGRDGWRFEPEPDETYRLCCRGQVVPSSRALVYELFVEEVHDGDAPRLYADVLCSVDGLKAFHCRRMGLRLVPDWPLSSRPELLATRTDPGSFATAEDVRGDYASLLACAWGRPSDAFGAMYRPFDGARRAPRLPGPPYHFMSRLVRIDAGARQPCVGAAVEAEYDVPDDAWYFQAGGTGAMPFCVLMEANLQPCGWLATFLGFALKTSEDLVFRNLDGTAAVAREIPPGAGTLRTRVTLTRFSGFGGNVIVSFTTVCSLGDEPVCRLETSFGFFTADSMAHQTGLPSTPQEVALLECSDGLRVELSDQPRGYFAGPLRLPTGPLRMIDRITGYWPEGGKAGLGRLVSEQTVDPDAWYFKAHFYQDPVQPGSLGVEAMIQLLQFFMIEKGMDEGSPGARFEPIAAGREVVWKYRGQVVPRNRRVRIEMEVVEIGRDEKGRYAVADAWLWVDSMRIYQVRGLAVRVRPDTSLPARSPGGGQEFVLDPAAERWLGDHRPTFTVAAAPMTWMAEVLAGAAHDRRRDGKVVRIERLQALRWLVCEEPRRLRASSHALPDSNGAERFRARLEVREPGPGPLGGRWETVAVADVLVADRYPEATATPDPLTDAEDADLPYESRAMFHGPAFRLMRRLRCGSNGATALLDAGGPGMPIGLLHPALLDCVWHSLTRSNVSRWVPRPQAAQVTYPTHLDFMEFHGPTPREGEVTCEVRLDAADPDGERLWFCVWMHSAGRPWMHARAAVILKPLGGFAGVSEAETAAFLERRRPLRGGGVSSHDWGVTRLRISAVRSLDFLPGTIARAFATSGDPKTLTLHVAVKEHLARTRGVHPAEIAVDAALLRQPGPLRITWEGEEVVVSGALPG